MSANGERRSASLQTSLELEDHYDTAVGGLGRGKLTPVLGAGASLFGRHQAQEWHGAPSAQELAERLAHEFRAKDIDTADLLMVAQWVYAMRGGSGQLYEELHRAFDHDFPATPLHDFLAGVPRALREHDLGKPLLIVTTNYDDLMERSLQAAGEEYDLVVYMADGRHKGMFAHQPPGGELVPITDPESCTDVDPDQRTVVLKLHGFVCRQDASLDSYVITEDHYIEYLTRTDFNALLPPHVVGRLLDCHLLFLGYSLRDWNLRSLLYRLRVERLRDNDWWAVQLDPSRLERKSWENRQVRIFNIPLEVYLDGLASAFATWVEEEARSMPVGHGG